MRTLFLTAMLAGALGMPFACSEYEFGADADQTDPRGDGWGDEEADADVDADADGDGDADVDWDVDIFPPDSPSPPPEVVEDCDGATAAIAPEQMAVMSWSQEMASGTISVPTAGWYHLYDSFLAESGNAQWNESTYFRVPTTARPLGRPYYANCDGEEWIVVDTDNFGAPAGGKIYIGTFLLEAGDNAFEMHHYCPAFRAGACPQHHYGIDATCEGESVNSAHFSGDGICLMPA